jgi:hypothetical protein
MKLQLFVMRLGLNGQEHFRMPSAFERKHQPSFIADAGRGVYAMALRTPTRE